MPSAATAAVATIPGYAGASGRPRHTVRAAVAVPTTAAATAVIIAVAAAVFVTAAATAVVAAVAAAAAVTAATAFAACCPGAG